MQGANFYESQKVANIKRQRLVVLVLSVLLVIGTLFVFLNLYRMHSQVTLETEQQVAEQRYLSQLQASLGFEGMIHHFKNYLLRRDRFYRERAIASAEVALEQADALTALNAKYDPLSNDIEVLIGSYLQSIDTILQQPELSAEDLDRLVLVDDARVASALDIAILESARQWVAIEAKIERMRIQLLFGAGLFVLLAAGIAATVWYFFQINLKMFRVVQQGHHDLSDGQVMLKAIDDASSDATLLVNEQGLIEYCNQTALRMFAYDDLVGHSINSLLPASSASRHKDYLQMFFHGNYDHPFNVVRKGAAQDQDGGRLQVAVALNVIEQKGRRLAVVNIKDITARERLTEQLQLSESLYRSTFEEANFGIAHVGLDGRWLRVNPKLLSMLGYEAAELQKLTFQDITVPEDLAKDLELYNRTLAGDIDRYRIEKRYLKQDGSILWALLTVRLVKSEAGESKFFISSIEDIGPMKQKQSRLANEAIRDPLTGVLNRRGYEQVLARFMVDYQQNSKPFSLVAFDLNDFKTVNDNYGHSAGDFVLKAFSASIVDHCRASDVVARIGGDEFVLLISGTASRRAISSVVRQVEDVMHTPVVVEGERIAIRFSYGAASVPVDTNSQEELVTLADQRMYKNKKGRKKLGSQ